MEAIASLKEMRLITVNMTENAVASTFVLSLRLLWVAGEVLGWKSKVVVGEPWEPGYRGGWKESNETEDTGLLEPTLSLVLPGQCAHTVTKATLG